MDTSPYRITYYADAKGEKPFRKWFLSLRDRTAIQRIAARLDRIEAGNLGVIKPVGNGVFEIKIDYGPGYRVYYSVAGNQIILLLIGGDKSTQGQDIATAQAYWKEHQERHQ